MKNKALIFLLSLFVTHLFAFEEVQLKQSGVISTDDDIDFCLSYWDGKINQTQGHSKRWEVLPQQNSAHGIRQIVEGCLHYGIDKNAPWKIIFSKGNNQSYNYIFSIQNLSIPLTWRCSLKRSKFSGRTLELDQKKILLPLEKIKTSIFSGSVRSISIPCSNGRLSLFFTRKVYVQIKDWGKNGFSFWVIIHKGHGADQKSKLQLQFKWHKYTQGVVDLTSAANMGFCDKKSGDGKGGWTDQGAENDLRMLPIGRQYWHGIEFLIINPAKNNNKSCIVLAGGGRQYFPDKVGTSPQHNLKGKWLFLLHSSAWTMSGEQIGSVNIIYDDGSTQKIAVNTTKDVGNWWQPAPKDNAEVVWTGENGNSFVGLYRSAFPILNKAIKKIYFTSTRRSVWMIVAASVGSDCPPKLMTAPRYIVSDKNWKPIVFHKDVISGSILDFSWMQDAPAGKYGPVVIRNGHFEFENRPGNVVRFYGSNTCVGAPFVKKEWTRRLVKRWAQYGFNIFRLHHHDGRIGRDDCTYELDLKRVDQIDYLVYCLKKYGIYFTTDLYVSRRLPAGEIPEYPEALNNIQAYKAMFWIADPFFENWKKHVKNYLTHINPYTQLALKDDPALVCINLINEGNISSCWKATRKTSKIYEKLFDKWLKEKKISPKSPGERDKFWGIFLAGIYKRRYHQMVDFVRKLGVKCPLSDQNNGNGIKLAEFRSEYDYVDNHAYFSHPKFPKVSWRLPATVIQKSAIKTLDAVPSGILPTRIYNKPFTVTEFDFARPNRYRAEGPALIGAYAGLQGWDMLVQFAYSHGTENYQRNDQVDGFFDLSTDPVKSLAQRIGVALFSTAGIKSIDKKFVVWVDKNSYKAYNAYFSRSISHLGFLAQIGIIVTDGKIPLLPPQTLAVINPGNLKQVSSCNEIPCFKADKKTNLPQKMIDCGIISKNFYDAAAGIYRSLDGAIELNQKRGTFRASSLGGETLILPERSKLDGHFMSVKNHYARGVFAVIPTERKNLKTAKRFLVLHLTDTLGSKIKFASNELNYLESWGKIPFLVEKGSAELKFKQSEVNQYRLFAVDTAGKRLREIQASKRTPNVVIFPVNVFQKFGQVMAYELIKK